MKNFSNLLTLAVALFMSLGVAANNDTKVRFASFDINEARKKAGEEGKLIFVDFYASWCTPCQWMEKTTFADEEVAGIMNTDFVALKVNIDEFAGYDLKVAYEVKYLPTMLIFNSQGQLIDKVEATMSPRKLVEWLNTHNTTANKTIVRHDFNTKPAPIQAQSIESPSMKATQQEYTRAYNEKTTGHTYTVQVGVFERFDGAQGMVNNLRQLFTDVITVAHDMKDDHVIYKVRLGQFQDEESARKFKEMLKADYNMEGMVL